MVVANGKTGKQVTLPVDGKGAERIPTKPPVTDVDLKPRKYPIGAGKT